LRIAVRCAERIDSSAVDGWRLNGDRPRLPARRRRHLRLPYAFGFLHVSKQPEAAVAVLHNDVLPFYRQLDLPVGAVLTDNGREFCGTERHPYELYLALNDIEHRKTKVRTPRTNGFVERFNGTVLEEFFRPAMHQNLYASVDALQADLDAWLHHYNRERPHLGYRTQGRRPWETVELFVRQEG
jgi:Integrase core domain